MWSRRSPEAGRTLKDSRRWRINPLHGPSRGTPAAQRRPLPAGSACILGTEPLPASRPTSLLLYRTESSASTILDGSSCFMLFHQSANGKKQRVGGADRLDPDPRATGTQHFPTCTIPVREVIRSFRALFPLGQNGNVTQEETLRNADEDGVPVLPVSSTNHDQDEGGQSHGQHGHQYRRQHHI